jgi:hypothetical protein
MIEQMASNQRRTAQPGGVAVEWIARGNGADHHHLLALPMMGAERAD